ncbi:putative F-box protein [Cardamine amara subsp. amara]|uniref:F-box protein n=1 Tax=Cardamine amara subsp. amara TaxID=228776 RepID=A0ABD1BP64_CARAN
MPFRYYCKICPPVNGLVCLEHIGQNYKYAVISNPITGEYVTTPRLITEKCMILKEKMYFGYDPIEKQFKFRLTKLNFSDLTSKQTMEHKWSYHLNILPQVLRQWLLESPFSAGMIQSGKIFLYPKCARNPFSTLYYNLEKNMITSVELHVSTLGGRVYTVPNFVEDVKLM